jgi:cytochrome c-type biogenesis protein CcmH/NrfG
VIPRAKKKMSDHDADADGEVHWDQLEEIAQLDNEAIEEPSEEEQVQIKTRKRLKKPSTRYEDDKETTAATTAKSTVASALGPRGEKGKVRSKDASCQKTEIGEHVCEVWQST